MIEGNRLYSFRAPVRQRVHLSPLLIGEGGLGGEAVSSHCEPTLTACRLVIIYMHNCFLRRLLAQREGLIPQLAGIVVYFGVSKVALQLRFFYILPYRFRRGHTNMVYYQIEIVSQNTRELSLVIKSS
jgi:hypothetical protein